MNLRKIRQMKDVTQLEVAQAAKVQPGKISAFERGRCDLRLQEAISAAKFLGVSLNELAGYESSAELEQ
jgi:transcriptional regulator with XRE-family HTH domain